MSACNCEKKPSDHVAEPALVKLVSHEQLATLLPRLEGWEGEKPAGSVVKNGKLDASRATASYKKQAREQTLSVNLELVDGSQDPSVFAPMTIMVHSGADALGAHKRGVEIQGFRGIEE